MRQCASETEVKNRRLRKQLIKNARSQKYWGLLFPIPLTTAIIISLIFNVLIWRALGFKRNPDKPFEDELINQF